MTAQNMTTQTPDHVVATIRYNVQFVDPGMKPKDYANLNEQGVVAALVHERKVREYTKAFVKVGTALVQVLQRELGSDVWLVHRTDGPLAHIGNCDVVQQ